MSKEERLLYEVYKKHFIEEHDATDEPVCFDEFCNNEYQDDETYDYYRKVAMRDANFLVQDNISTVGELKKMIEALPDDYAISCTGIDSFSVGIDKQRKCVYMDEKQYIYDIGISEAEVRLKKEAKGNEQGR